jgi:hypothetical protein
LGVKVKGGMYCRRCNRPVMAQKSGHGVRNTLAVGGTLATAGLSLLGAKSEKWRCPNCGGPCVPESQIRQSEPSEDFWSDAHARRQSEAQTQRRPRVRKQAKRPNGAARRTDTYSIARP